MTVPSDALTQSPLDPGVFATAPMSATRPFYWSVRRELWENRSIFIAPLIAAGAVLFGFLISTAHLSRILHAVSDLDPARQSIMATIPYDIAAFAIIATAVIVGFFYCLGALHNERRDRSILFWKSLPVSDLTTVLAKAMIPLVVLPLVTFVVIIVLQLVMLALSAVALLANGLGAATPWTQPPCSRCRWGCSTCWPCSRFWYAPNLGLAVLVSGLGATESVSLGRTAAARALRRREDRVRHLDAGRPAEYRLNGLSEGFIVKTGHGVMSGLPQPRSHGFPEHAGPVVGLGFARAFLAAAVWQRRYREPL